MGRSCEEGKVPSHWEPFHQLGDQPGQIGSFRGLEESAPAGLRQAEQRKTSTDSPGYVVALTSRDIHLLMCLGAGC